VDQRGFADRAHDRRENLHGKFAWMDQLFGQPKIRFNPAV
jgi:hypothetical protein